MIHSEDEPHLLSGKCEMFGDIRGKYGELNDNESLVRFFKEVLEMRDIIDKEEKENDSGVFISKPVLQDNSSTS